MARTYTTARAITPSDSGEHLYNALWIGTGGTININPWNGASGDDNNVSFTNVQDGTLLTIKTYRVNLTGTSAPDGGMGIVGLD